MREGAGIIGTILFLKLNCVFYTLVLKFMGVRFLIMLYNLHIHYIITYFLCNLGDDFSLDDDFGVFKTLRIYNIKLLTPNNCSPPTLFYL